VRWYSMVAFQWRKVWKLICISLGFLSFVTILLRWSWKLFLMASGLALKTLFEVLGSSLSMLVSLLDILRFLALLPFSGVTLIEPFTESMSVQSNWHASPHRMPVSLSN